MLYDLESLCRWIEMCDACTPGFLPFAARSKNREKEAFHLRSAICDFSREGLY